MPALPSAFAVVTVVAVSSVVVPHVAIIMPLDDELDVVTPLDIFVPDELIAVVLPDELDAPPVPSVVSSHAASPTAAPPNTRRKPTATEEEAKEVFIQRTYPRSSLDEQARAGRRRRRSQRV